MKYQIRFHIPAEDYVFESNTKRKSKLIEHLCGELSVLDFLERGEVEIEQSKRSINI